MSVNAFLNQLGIKDQQQGNVTITEEHGQVDAGKANTQPPK